MQSRTPKQTNPIITLLTDFGCRDPYVGAVRGAILSICPAARLVDITHEIAPFDVLEGAYALASACGEFPAGTIHLAVVDPGVGSSRRPIVARTDRFHFVGPDNGLLALALEREKGVEARQIANRKYLRPSPHPTFHARDLFGPAAAHLAQGVPATRLGEPLTRWRAAPLPPLHRSRAGSLRGAVLHVDRFGNTISNIDASRLPPGWIRDGAPACRARVGSRTVGSTATHYAGMPPGRPFLLVNSFGYVEAALRDDSLARRWRVRRGDLFELVPLRPDPSL